jgi:hypothetical protein
MGKEIYSSMHNLGTIWRLAKYQLIVEMLILPTLPCGGFQGYITLPETQGANAIALGKTFHVQYVGTKIFPKIRGPFEKFVDSPYYSESELCGGVVTVFF